MHFIISHDRAIAEQDGPELLLSLIELEEMARTMMREDIFMASILP